MIQKQVASLVQERGYWDDLEPERLVCRHVAKLVEELGEATSHIGKLNPPFRWLIAADVAAEVAREEFDNLDAWQDYYICSIDALKAELADLQVVLFSIAEVLEFDIAAAALEKAQADVKRGVR